VDQRKLAIDDIDDIDELQCQMSVDVKSIRPKRIDATEL
jgi:hypothetical protein